MEYMKRVLRDQDHKEWSKENLQKLYDEISECLAENMANDGTDKTETVFCLDEVAQWFANFGWVASRKRGENWKTLDNTWLFEQYKKVLQRMGVQEHSVKIPSFA
jgi:hypothetical protein